MCSQPRSLFQCWKLSEYAEDTLALVFAVHIWRASGGLLYSNSVVWRALCGAEMDERVAAVKWGYSAHCLPQRQMACQCSSRNRAPADWWESCTEHTNNGAAAIIKMKCSQSLLYCSPHTPPYSQTCPQPGVRETSPWTSQRSPPRGSSLNCRASRAETSSSWPATAASSRPVSRELIGSWPLVPHPSDGWRSSAIICS